MKNKKCEHCLEYKNCKDSFTSWIFFIIGIISTIAIRVVTILADSDPIYAKIAWYIGVGGFFIFFAYKFKVGQAKERVIKHLNLADKINNKEAFSEQDFKVIGEILCSLTSKKERINYILIFVLSALALIFSVFIDFIIK